VAYLLDAAYFSGVNTAHIQQTTGIQNLRVFDYLNTHVAFPPLSEQRRIAAFLDVTCAVIDGAVAAKRTQLEILANLHGSILLQTLTTGLRHLGTKHTGSVVLPEIPREWRLCRLKSVASVRYGLGQPPPELASGVAMIRATDVDAGTIRTGNLLRVDPQELPPGKDAYLRAGEIIVVRSGAYTGDSAIVPPALEGSVAGYDMVVSPTYVSPRFLAYCLLSRYVLEGQLLLLTLRAAQPHLNAEELGSVLVAMPPTRREQDDIVDFLDTTLAGVVEVATNIQSQIAVLTGYRHSLIHECVTGERQVTNADLTHATHHA
jgi:type I restriction enzyme S subunit